MIKTLKDNETELRVAFTQDLKGVLIYFAKGKLTPSKAEQIAEETMRKIDIYDEVFAHKGVNWLAKKILYYMGLSDRNI